MLCSPPRLARRCSSRFPQLRAPRGGAANAGRAREDYTAAVPAPLLFRLLRAYSAIAPTERGGFRLARLARRLVPRDRWQDRFTVGGLTFGLDLTTYPDVAMAGGVYELDTLRVLRRRLGPGVTFVDGGANLGYFTCRAAAWGAAVIAVEPDPVNRVRLEANLAANDLTHRVDLRPVALSDEAGVATFHRPVRTDRANHGESGRFPREDVPSEPFEVELRRLDDLIATPPDVVKLDLEGSETLAVRGAAGWFDGMPPPAWVIEHGPEAVERVGGKPGDVWRTLLEFEPRYHCRFIGRSAAFASPDEMDCFARQGNVLIALDA